MIARFIFIGMLFLFISTPALGQASHNQSNGTPDEIERFAKLHYILDGGLKCQAALALTSNYNVIYRALNQGLEKNDPPEAKKFSTVLQAQWNNLENIVSKAKIELAKIPGFNVKLEEKRLYTEAQEYLTGPLRALKVDPEHIRLLMVLNSECVSQSPIILKQLKSMLLP